MLRSHTCGELDLSHKNSNVELCGWVDQHRDIGQLFFLSLRDRYGATQCVFETSDENSKTLIDLKKLSYEDCLKVCGRVRERSEKDKKANMATGMVELVIESFEVLNPSKVLPFQVRDDISVSDDLRFKHRYIDLRRPKMQKNLQIRHQVIQATRSALNELNFLEVETPLFIRSTPEGARDFVVPSRTNPGKFYALPQSPQLYKQMLMISGCDRYFQFAPAFRDEDLRADRVPVHTQIDMEMSFVEEKDVYHAVESYMGRVFKEVKGIELNTPFHIMPYKEAMERFGIDKPDTRFGYELKTVTELAQTLDFGVFQNAECVRCLVVPEGDKFSRKDIDAYTKKAGVYGAKGLAWSRLKDGKFSGGVAKFLNAKPADFIETLGLDNDFLVMFVADSYNTCCAALAHIRLDIGQKLGAIDEYKFNFLWVNEFPLFEWDEDRQAYNAMHHLFTQPMDEDMKYLDSDPSKVRGKLYDLVLNGVELCSGSIRINRPEIQKTVLDIVKMPREEAESKFGFLLEAFEYGAPPHGGSAVGLDRLVAILCGESSIREVIAYPCNNNGVFPLDGSPASVDLPQLEELGLAIVEKRESEPTE